MNVSRRWLEPAAEPDPAVTRRLVDRMTGEAFRVARIIDDLLDLTRIEAEESVLGALLVRQ